MDGRAEWVSNMYIYNTKVCLSNVFSSFLTALAWILPDILSIAFMQVVS